MAGMKGKQTVRDMVLSMAAIGVVVAGVYTLVPHDDSVDPVKPVDYRVELITARRAAPYPVVAPVGLPETWKPTSVSYDRQEGDAWHLGFLDPEREYIAVEQSSGPAEKFVHEVSQRAAKTAKTVRIGDETWQRWEGPKYDALVREDKGATTVVTGTASQKRLAEMAGALDAEKS
ncbi:DUF4245 domain-containing protein [Streptomyces sp. NPDC054887]